MPMHLRERRPHLITARLQPEDKFCHERAEDFDNNANLANYVLSPDAHIAHLRRSARGIVEGLEHAAADLAVVLREQDLYTVAALRDWSRTFSLTATTARSHARRLDDVCENIVKLSLKPAAPHQAELSSLGLWCHAFNRPLDDAVEISASDYEHYTGKRKRDADPATLVVSLGGVRNALRRHKRRLRQPLAPHGPTAERWRRFLDTKKRVELLRLTTPSRGVQSTLLQSLARPGVTVAKCGIMLQVRAPEVEAKLARWVAYAAAARDELDKMARPERALAALGYLTRHAKKMHDKAEDVFFLAAQARCERTPHDELHALICPISQLVARDPVRAPDGFVYERAQIAAWLAKHKTSPMKRGLMTLEQLNDTGQVPFGLVRQLGAEVEAMFGCVVE